MLLVKVNALIKSLTLRILDEVDSKHKTPQALGEPIPSKISNLITKYWKNEPSNFSTIKKLERMILLPENCEEICVP